MVSLDEQKLLILMKINFLPFIVGNFFFNLRKFVYSKARVKRVSNLFLSVTDFDADLVFLSCFTEI